jgi:ferredoxin
LLENTNHLGLRKASFWSKCPPIGKYVAILTLVGSVVGYPVLLWMDPLCIFSSPFAVNKATNLFSVILVCLGLGVLVGGTFVFGMLWCVRICPLSGLQDMLFAMRKALWMKFAASVPNQKFSGRQSLSPDVKLVEITGAADNVRAKVPEPKFANALLGGRSFSSDIEASRVNGALAPEVHARASARKFSAARRVFFAGAGGAILAVLARRLGAARYRKSDTLLRPPGAVPEDRFAGLCIRCNNCVHACPTKIIHPDTGHEAGLAGFAAPVIKFDRDYKYCLETCNDCTQVCPTGALIALPLQQKNKYIIGEALVDNNVCLTALGKKECDACELACPYDAVKITWDEAQYNAYPVVNDKCIGCGACEVVCPTTPVRAIRVWTQKPA